MSDAQCIRCAAQRSEFPDTIPTIYFQKWKSSHDDPQIRSSRSVDFLAIAIVSSLLLRSAPGLGSSLSRVLCLVCLVKWVACAGSEKGRENGTGVCESVEDFHFDVLEVGRTRGDGVRKG